MPGKLFLVATPIGNYKDITLRAVEVLEGVDIIVVEEFKEGSKLLKKYSIQKELHNLNEHNESEKTDELIDILLKGKDIALMSDSGTPVFSDPGRILVKKAIDRKIKIIPIPGASSLMPALIVSGFKIDRFLFYGWLSPKSEKRRAELKFLKNEKNTIVLMDTPYRLNRLLQDILSIIGKRRICLAYNLTMEDEEIFYGNAEELLKIVSERKLKGEFVLILENL
ncbi:MAG: rRNA small subunit methyltransferase I [Ignavibacteriae bacterium]|nr:MAG: rRNA small subunit methyltransferase I [Ignavibacteriota bacterium]